MIDSQNSKDAGGKAATGGSRPEPPALSLPKGGGAIRGMGEKFAANPVTGTGSLSVAIAVSPGRSGFSPQLTLSYDSGAGNGPFGLGWSLSLPAITRKTDKGLPRYRDAEESDVFILSGAEDLVPVLDEDGMRWQHERDLVGVAYNIHRYRPRIEGLFARIERWTNLETGEIHWRSITRDNITTLYGKDNNSRIFDPDDPDLEHPTRIFSWLICESYDDKGNVIVYEYTVEDTKGVGASDAHEANRTASGRSANRYLKLVRYGNRTPYFPSLQPVQPPTPLPSDWMFELVFDYGEHDAENPAPGGASDWLRRLDPFSSYRAGFEVRTYRLCRRALMFHHFPDELGVDDYLVRSTEFTYAESPIASFITSVSQSGYVRRDDGSYLKKSLPPLEFAYSPAVLQDEVKEIDAESLENLPYGLDGTRYQWVDLDGEGISGILTEQTEGWFYKRNLSQAPVDGANGEASVEARFAQVELVARKPSPGELDGGRQQFLDLAGDGQIDLVQLRRPFPGYFERTHDGDWANFVPFEAVPNVGWDDPNLKMVDLTGDGHGDILISENEVFTWYPSLAEAGFGPVETVRQVLDEEKGPRLVFADGAHSIYLADLSGDGLTDLVRICSGEVCYWPNLGYGRFGAKVTMDNAPSFDAPDLFNQTRIHLADIDGSGVTDILYMGPDGVDVYLNESGNSWSARERLAVFPQVDDLSAVTAVDLLGNGTACLVWSSSLPGDAHRPMRYIDLMGGQKPHLLVKTVNNLGAETHAHYAPSTKFYVEDKLAGRPWITRLPFPVHVIERVETYDRISRNRFATRYAYHHGYFDGIEREFRGFGMVEQWDTEAYATLSAGGDGSEAVNIDAASHVPPVLTRTWFHTGAYLGRDHVSDFFAGVLDEKDVGEYYREPGLTDTQARRLLLDDTVLPAGWTVEDEREGCRALKGSMLRQEVYALDGSDKEQHPYAVTEQNFVIRRLQPRDENRHAVFFTHALEVLRYHYERNPADPRVGHALTLEVDDFGNVLKSVSVGYGRPPGLTTLTGEDKTKQEQLLLTYTETDVTNAVDEPDGYRTPLPCAIRTYELSGYDPAAGALRFSVGDFAANDFAAITTAEDIPYSQNADGNGTQKRLIEHVRTLYRQKDLSGPLPLFEIDSMALPHESYKLAFTPDTLDLYAGKISLDDVPTILNEEGRYVDLDSDAQWWIPSGQAFFSPDIGDAPAQELTHARQHFFLPHRFRDPFEETAFVRYDPYDLLILETEDALQNKVTAGERDEPGNIIGRIDYRVLQPVLVTDPNRNRSAVIFDALGLVVGTAVMGKIGENKGDVPDGFTPDLDEFTLLDHLQNPLADPQAILQDATTRLAYNLFAYHRTRDEDQPQPSVVYSLARETHSADLEPGEQPRIQHSFSYSDGFGREIQKKIQAEPGPLDDGGTTVSPRWVGSGWTIFNNKGKPVRQYEPFFSATHRFEFGVQVGVSPILFYDPVERVVTTLHPNHTWEKVVFDPWKQITYDGNDTVFANGMETGDPRTDADIGGFVAPYFNAQSDTWPTWHQERITGAKGAQEQRAAEKAAMHANTPTTAHFDTLGRPFLTVAHNRFTRNGTVVDEEYATRVELDIEGNQREVIDARDRVVMRYDYDMLGSRIHQASMEAGERWMLNDVTGKPIRGWDSRGFSRRMLYDVLRRPVELLVGDGVTERMAGGTEYGESQGDALNNRTRVFRVFDGAGVVTNDAYDFKGNLLTGARQLLQDYKNPVDWAQSPELESEIFTSGTRYDALSRPVELTAPDGSLIRPRYNEANLIEHVEANLRVAPAVTVFVENIDYNARGQRTSIEYGNSTLTEYEYDAQSFRLTHLKTTRSGFPVDERTVQDLHYTYDPADNITHIQDDAQQTIYFNGAVVPPHCDYTYDAVYRLIEAKGREHIGQAGQPETTWNDAFRVNLPHPHDGQAMRSYTEQYEYDPVANFEQMIHQAAGGSWTRAYAYEEESLLEPSGVSNRLSRTTVGQATATYSTDGDGYDAHGNMLRMPHLPMMRWDDKDQLQATSRQVVNNGGLPELTYYVYDASGQRARKVTERQAAVGITPTRRKERMYLGGFEVYREYASDGSTVVLERETVHVMDGQQRIVLVETKTIDGQASMPNPQPLLRYQFSNHLGSASLELDDAGAVVSYEEYYPYGSTSYQAGRSATEVGLKRYRYTGKERDEETGFNYHRARYYSAWLGTWVSCDPLSLVDGVNLYRYVGRNPIVMADEDGTQGQNAGAGGASGGGSAGAHGAGVGVDPETEEREAAANLEAEARTELRYVKDRFEEAIGGPLYKRIEASNGHVYVIDKEKLSALGVSDEDIGMLDERFRTHKLVPLGVAVRTHVGQLEPGLPWYEFVGTDAEHRRYVAEAEERLREERHEAAKQALIALLSRGTARMGRNSANRGSQGQKKAPSPRYPRGRVTAKASTDLPTLRVKRADGSRAYVQLSTGITVQYDAKGNPDFTPFLYGKGKNTVTISYTGIRKKDERAANAEAGYAKTPKGYTWHHASGQSMQLVRSDVHDAFQHVGEFARHKASQ